jgi:hypothetical protein
VEPPPGPLDSAICKNRSVSVPLLPSRAEPHVARPQSSLALLLAGQIRTFVEPQVRHELYRTIVSSSQAVTFAHLSPESTYAPWHLRGSSRASWQPGRRLASHEVMLNETVVQLVVRETRALFRPTFLRVETDTATTNHTRWTGRLRGDSAASSVLAFRWLLLLEVRGCFTMHA